jgi:hypothetical protein
LCAVVLVCLSTGCLGFLNQSPPPLPPGTNETGVNVSALNEAHTQALLERGSFSYRRERTASLPADAPRPDAVPTDTSAVERWSTHENRMVRHYRVNATDGSSQYSTVKDVYSVNNTWYVRRGVAAPRYFVNENRADRESKQDAFEQQLNTSTKLHSLYGWNYTHAGTVERDGRTLHKFTSRERTHDTNPLGADRVTNASATLLIAPDGVVVYQEYTFDGAKTVQPNQAPGGSSTTSKQAQIVPVSYNHTVRYSELGSTTVERPEWVSKARTGGE